jgi:leucyl/phenylalanyl-tRNA--protein transferase
VHDSLSLSLETVLSAYAHGFFPMGDGYSQGMHWYNPELRAVMPIANIHVSRRLKSFILKHPFEIRIDTAFSEVIEGCAENRVGDWINQDIQTLFTTLHRAGFAHSLECWKDDKLVGGIYGLALGQAFCAESMFSRVSSASKVALVHLCALLQDRGFTLLDCQIWNAHTGQFGAYEIPQAEYLRRLSEALQNHAEFSMSDDSQTLISRFLRNSGKADKR